MLVIYDLGPNNVFVHAQDLTCENTPAKWKLVHPPITNKLKQTQIFCRSANIINNNTLSVSPEKSIN